MLSWEGAAYYGASLVVVKTLHELGHAFMAVRYGLRVPTIGIAFMVLMPVLYTDTSGAWRLRSRRERLMIDGAGIFTELALATVATVLWVFLPEGGLRLCVFAIATTSWVTSLAVNLNPLMRFDGYYILSDSLGFQNLQNRGFEMARWQMRELLFGLGLPAPELLSRRMRRLIVLHAWATWIYRFFLFLGIAILVYAFFIKVVGVILFVIEIVWFILLPIAREMRHWWEIKDKIMKTPRFLISGTAVIAAIGLAITPWSTNITVPAVLTAEQEQTLYAPFPARVIDTFLQEGSVVKKGEVVAILEAPQLDLKLRNAKERRKLLESRIDRSGSDAQDRASLIVLTNELAEVREEIDGLRRVVDELTIRAPFDGRVTDVDPELQEGLWINASTPLAMVQGMGGSRIKGYVAETDVFRFAPGANASFVPDNPELAVISSKVEAISEAGAEKLDAPYLALRHGGKILSEDDEQGALKPTDAHYAVSMMPIENQSERLHMAVRGVALVTGAPESFYQRVKKQVLKVFVREMGV